MTLVKAEGRELYLGQEILLRQGLIFLQRGKGIYLIPPSDPGNITSLAAQAVSSGVCVQEAEKHKYVEHNSVVRLEV